ncbi:MAG: rubredoxin [Rhodocyclaceae bacterium]|nr:rubredoxin [Rhodocyclaceae bacterium]MBX3669816.1 rubredoxin [Rhodocyclaceae bacterium]
MKRWMCQVCTYLYDEALGDPHAGIAPGTAWSDVADSWCCPHCGAIKAMFDLAAI